MAVFTSVYFENALLNTLRGTAYSVATVYASLHTATPGQTGANEATGGSPAYARVAVTFTAPSGGSMASAATVTFNVPAGTYTHIGYWDSQAGGNYLFGDPLGASQTFGAQGTYSLAGGNITVIDNTL